MNCSKPFHFHSMTIPSYLSSSIARSCSPSLPRNKQNHNAYIPWFIHHNGHALCGSVFFLISSSTVSFLFDQRCICLWVLVATTTEMNHRGEKRERERERERDTEMEGKGELNNNKTLRPSPIYRLSYISQITLEMYIDVNGGKRKEERRKEKKWGCIDDKRNGDSLKVGQVGRPMVHVRLVAFRDCRCGISSLWMWITQIA